MRNTRGAQAVALGCQLLLLAGAAAAQRARTAAPALPPISMTCPHHPDVIESAPGVCPFCKMTLVPVRLAPAWTCPVHAATIADAAGTCPICRRTLVPVTVSLTWTCRGSNEQHLEPGTCADGSARTRTRTLRPHGDHNPRHGGQFFMAADNWHHVEGVHPAPDVFRLYVYDEYARPLAAERMKAVQGRVSIAAPDARRSVTRAFPLRVAADSGYLEAQVARTPLSIELSARVRFARDGEEYQFDFTFPGLTRTEPSAPGAPAAAAVPAGSRASRTPAGPQATRGAAAAIARGAAEPRDPAQDPALLPLPIPETVPDILAQMRTRTDQVGSLIARGDFAAVWVPAFAAKDLALALEPHVPRLAPSRRDEATEALQRVVRLAWLLDAHGDTGNRQQLLAAHASFSAAVADAVRVFGSLR